MTWIAMTLHDGADLRFEDPKKATGDGNRFFERCQKTNVYAIQKVQEYAQIVRIYSSAPARTILAYARTI